MLTYESIMHVTAEHMIGLDLMGFIKITIKEKVIVNDFDAKIIDKLANKI